MNQMAAVISPADEIELVTKAQQGDRNAYSELVRVHASGILNVVYRVCDDAKKNKKVVMDVVITARFDSMQSWDLNMLLEDKKV
jgi:hypothetical protein